MGNMVWASAGSRLRILDRRSSCKTAERMLQLPSVKDLQVLITAVFQLDKASPSGEYVMFNIYPS